VIFFALAVLAGLLFVAGGALILFASQAMGLLVMPVLVSSNVYQALQGGLWRISVRRFGAWMAALAAITLLAIYWSIRWSVPWRACLHWQGPCSSPT